MTPRTRSFALLPALSLLALATTYGEARAQAVADKSSPPTGPPAAPRSDSRFLASPWLLNLHVDVGVEPHPQGNPVAFGVGGAALWRGAVGLGLGLYASEGAPVMVAMGKSGLADRVTATAAIAIRLAPLTWQRSDSWLTRFVGGVGVEIGPALEYLRSSSLLIPGCAVSDQAYKAALHAQLHVEVPILGNASSGWIALRVAGRLSVTSETQLAPTQPSGQATCSAQIVEPGVTGQLLFGLSYYR